MLTLTPINYNFNELEPYIDAKTLEIHHTKHHQTYLDNLNKLIQDNVDLQNKTVEQILTNLDKLDPQIQTAVLNNAGQVYNHDQYFASMTKEVDQSIDIVLLERINSDFGGIDKFKEQLKALGLSQFGSGWVFLVLVDGKLTLQKTSNANTPFLNGLVPMITMDVWEHAYYLKYQNKRADYIDNFIRVINWNRASQIYLSLVTS
jgi:superoxide dismutase, Fe-Mn family